MTKREIEMVTQNWLAGDESAFNTILEYYYNRLLLSSRKMLPSFEDAEEMVMNTMLKIWIHKERLSAVERFEDYLFGVLRQEIVARSRKKVIVTENIEDFSLTHLGAVEHPELNLEDLQKKYLNALGKLTPKQREVFLLSREQDMNQRQIAVETGVSIHTVNNHITAALKIFREEMKEYPEALVLIIASSSALAMCL